MAEASTHKPIERKVTAATAAIACLELGLALVEWLAGVDVPATVEVPAAIVVTFAAGYLTNSRGKHARE